MRLIAQGREADRRAVLGRKCVKKRCARDAELAAFFGERASGERGKRQFEGRAAAGRVFHADVAPMRFDDFPGYGEAEAKTRRCLVVPPEGFEDHLAIRCGHALAMVDDADDRTDVDAHDDDAMRRLRSQRIVDKVGDTHSMARRFPRICADSTRVSKSMKRPAIQRQRQKR